MPDVENEMDEQLARDHHEPAAHDHAKHEGEPCGIAEITRPVPLKRESPFIDPRTLSLDRDDALLFIIDVQERFCAAMEPGALAAMLKNASVLLRIAEQLKLPVIASEQYPKGLGRTVPALAALMRNPPFEKIEFSAGNNQALARAVLETKRRQVIIAGMETHVCVFQTARDLTRAGIATFVVEDAVLSRTEANRDLGLRLCEKAGATRTGTEVVLFDLLGQAANDDFRTLAPLVR